MHILRLRDVTRLRRLLRTHLVVGILDPRQVGKTTLAREVLKGHPGKAPVFDLEDPADLARLADARLRQRETEPSGGRPS